MSRSPGPLLAALLRPVHVATLGVGLLLSLTWAPWWVFPVSMLFYGVMVVLALRDPEFVRGAGHEGEQAAAGQPIEWSAVARRLGRGGWTGPLERVAAAERNLAKELAQAPAAARAVLASTLGQVRSAAALGLQLAERQRSLEQALHGNAAMDAEASRREATDKRARAASAGDPAARKALLDAAGALEESARTSDSLRALRERTSTQLESLSVMLESVAVRSVRLRVQSDGASGDLSETLGAEVDAVRETLGVLESLDDEAAEARRV